jgi:hypothetical protein
MITYRKTGDDNSQFGKWTNWFAIIKPAVSLHSICIVLSKFVNLQHTISVCYNSLTKFIVRMVNEVLM